MKYIALLRGINVGGYNKVSMAELKTCFEQLRYTNVSTYINSGNVIFGAVQTDKAKLVVMCEQAIENRFGFHVICSVISAKELKAAVAQAPAWWGQDSESSHNAIFAIAPATAASVMREVGEAKREYEQIAAYEPVIFWSAPVATHGRTRYSKIVGSKAYQSITIRNSNTTRKQAKLVA